MNIKRICSLAFFAAASSSVYAMDNSTLSTTPKELEDHPLAKFFYKKQTFPILQPLYDQTDKEAKEKFNKKLDTSNITECFAYYHIPILIKKYEEQLKHAPHVLQNDLNYLKKNFLSFMQDPQDKTLLTSSKTVFDDAIQENNKIIKQPTYNLSVIEEIAYISPNPSIYTKSTEIPNTFCLFGSGTFFNTTNTKVFKNYNSVCEAIEIVLRSSADNYTPQKNSQNPYWDAQRDFVVPHVIKHLYEHGQMDSNCSFYKTYNYYSSVSSTPDYSVKKALQTFKTSIEESETKDFIKHMKPALEKIETAIKKEC